MSYYMPPEWALHQRMFIEWPVADPVWAENLPLAYEAFSTVAKEIARLEPITVLLNPGEEAYAKLLGDTVDICVVPHNDCWVRDNGCTFVRDGSKLVGLHWDFNAWGGKYPNVELDRRVPSEMCQLFGIHEHKVPMILEGGSIHTNGAGTILTTAECLLNPNRNPGMTKEEIDLVLCEHLGASRVVYIPEGLFADETDGHVDNIACFLDEKTVLLPCTEHRSDPNYERLRAARRVVKAAGFQIEDIIHPPLTKEKGEPLTLSYINFVFINNGIVMPGFGGDLSDHDAKAKERLAELFPDREIIQVNTRDIIRGGGNIHCITQQMPAV